MEKQLDFLGQSNEDNKYTTKVEVPIYSPKNKKPHILELCDNSKTRMLEEKIRQSPLEDQEKEFLIKAAQRHLVFNYEKIADFYAHSRKEVQELMEESALVIIDFEKAIELGYVKLCDKIEEQYMTEYNE